MHLYVNDFLKVAIISYPKSGSTSLQVHLLGVTNRSDDEKITKYSFDTAGARHWRTIEYRPQGVVQYSFLETLTNAVPKDYSIYTFVRDPVERYISGFVFVCHASYNLFFSDISDIQEKLGEQSDDYLLKYMEDIMRLASLNPTLNDDHMSRNIYPLLIIKTMYPNMKMVKLDDMNKTLCNIHNVPYVELEKRNAVEAGYDIGHRGSENQTGMKKLVERYKTLMTHRLQRPWDVNLQDHSSNWINIIKGYLYLERKIFDKIASDPNFDAMNLLTQIYITEESFLQKQIGTDYHLPNLNHYRGITFEYMKDEHYGEHQEIKGLLDSNRWRFGNEFDL
jgi:hypothetical protein